ncbi:MAG: tyrosine-type recombinase/integrase [Anaerolineae bacterium]
MTKTFTSCFASPLKEYIAFRRTLGVRSSTIPDMLYHFDRYVVETGHTGPLTLSLVTDFVCRNGCSATTKAQRYQILRVFADYFCVYEPRTERIPASLFQRPRSHPAPYIFTPDELSRLVAAAQNVSRRIPMRGQTLRAIIGLIACTGLRNSEVRGLDRKDVNLEQGILHIRNTKFDKSRRLPLHSSTTAVLSAYAFARDQYFGVIDCPAFFLTTRRTRFASVTLHQSFLEACELAGICRKQGPGPRIHDYADLFVMPTPARKSAHIGLIAAKMSA